MAKQQRPIGAEDLTPWFPPELKPMHVGEYNASQHQFGHVKRWWDGQDWSVHYVASDPEELKRERRAIKERKALARRIAWRGLSKKPE